MGIFTKAREERVPKKPFSVPAPKGEVALRCVNLPRVGRALGFETEALSFFGIWEEAEED